MSSILRSFKSLIYAHCGLVLEGIAEDRLRDIVQSNAEQTGCASLSEYERLIRSNSQLFDALVGQLTVNETYFFREPEQLKLLTEVLIPQVLAQKTKQQPVRILSAGCSSGEEPYSLVMALHQIYGERTAELFQIDAGDLDQNVLNKAESALYSEFSFRGVDDAVRQRYFKAQKRGYKLANSISEQVNFYSLNLLAPQYPAQISNYDIIFFRNVSIYFDLDARLRIQRKFYSLMNSQSILLLGSAETLGNDLGIFELVEDSGQYFFIKGNVYRPVASQALSLPQLPFAELARVDTVATLHASRTDAEFLVEPIHIQSVEEMTQPASARDAVMPNRLVDLAAIQHLIDDGQQQRALRLLENFSVHAAEYYAASLLKSWLLLNNQAFTEAGQLLDQALEIEPWSTDAMLMKGLLCKWQQRVDEACQWFKKVIYTNPECWPAHYYLADIRRNQQQFDAAIKSYQIVLRVLATHTSTDKCTAWIPLPLAASDALFLSQRYIQQLTIALQTTRVDE
ncbi:CheR family methyltransferase [Denitrificimonas caeni]|uniref:CheR family methyltransferase n=1 Tax=Denitrificimonas caeni TaxID=521720 RepID=UPI001965498D|nr:protein-glutamate O-methyltransferase CheR [Denitrificimonas caeni]